MFKSESNAETIGCFGSKLSRKLKWQLKIQFLPLIVTVLHF
ncbi:MAG: hypothetical protein QW066_05815 [Candidatus Methanomethylicia archaeon]